MKQLIFVVMGLSFRAKVQWLDEKRLSVYFGPYFTGAAVGRNDCIVEIVMVTFTLRVLVAIFP